MFPNRFSRVLYDLSLSSFLLLVLSITAQLSAFIFVLSCLTRSMGIIYLPSDRVRVGFISIRVELVAAVSAFSTRFDSTVFFFLASTPVSIVWKQCFHLATFRPCRILIYNFTFYYKRFLLKCTNVEDLDSFVLPLHNRSTAILVSSAPSSGEEERTCPSILFCLYVCIKAILIF